MKKIFYAAIFLCASNFGSLFAQPAPSFPGMPPSQGFNGRYVCIAQTNSLPKFNLDFSGGTPQQLIDAVEKATGKPLNTIIPDDCQNLQIPAR